MTATDYAPQGFHTVSPYLVVDDPAAAIDLYTRAFGAREILRKPLDCNKLLDSIARSARGRAAS